MTHTSTEQPEALMRLADNYAEACFDQGLNQRTTDDKPETEREKLENAIRRMHTRIAELEAQLSAIGAGGVEPLRKQAAAPQAVQVVELEVDDLIDRLLNAQQDLNLAANVHMDQSIASASTLLDEVEIALRTLAATHPTQQGLDAQTIKHISALSELVRMPNAEHFADAHNAAVRHLRVIAAQAKQGG